MQAHAAIFIVSLIVMAAIQPQAPRGVPLLHWPASYTLGDSLCTGVDLNIGCVPLDLQRAALTSSP